MREISYRTSISSSNGSSVVFGTGLMPNSINGTIIKDATNGNFTMSLSIEGVSLETINGLAFQCETKPIRKIQQTLSYKDNASVVFNGVITDLQTSDDNRNIDIIATSFDALSAGNLQITAQKRSTHKMIKQLFANELNLQLVSNITDDNKNIQKPYYYFGSSPISELKKMFPNQDVIINDGKLIFQIHKENDNEKESNLGNGYDISKQIVKAIKPISQHYIFLEKCVLMPNLNINFLIKINTNDLLNRNYNGEYRIIKVEHHFNVNYLSGNTDGYTNLILSNGSILKSF